MALSTMAGVFVALWLVGWSTGSQPLGAVSFSVDPNGFAVGAGGQTSSMPRARTGLVETNENRGQVLFGRFCDSCHPGGQSSFGPSLRDGVFKSRFTTEASVAAYIRGGGAVMPAYKAEYISDADLSTLAKYILSLPTEKR